jgi:hypothetical protein
MPNLLHSPVVTGLAQPASSATVLFCTGVSPLPFEDSAGSTPPSAFGSYRVLHQIGSGVLGPVFRTYEPQVDRLVAVKAFKLDLVPEDVARLADALRKLAANPTTHPGIVRVLDAGLEGTSPFVAMEYASGESLDVALRDFTPGLGRALPVLIDIGRAIDAAWAEGRGHGALHPRDVIVSTGVDTRITGFGIISALESIGAKGPVRRPYTAPERATGEAWGIRADVYSLGAIAHELLTGRRPLGSGEQDGTLAPELSPEQRVNVRRVIGAALAELPQDRYENAGAFVAALEAIARGEAAILPAPLVAQRTAAMKQPLSGPSAPAAPAARVVQPEQTAPKAHVDRAAPTPKTWHPTPPDAPRPAAAPVKAPEPRPAAARASTDAARSSDRPKPPESSRAAMAMVADSDERSGGAVTPAADIAPTDKPEAEFLSERTLKPGFAAPLGASTVPTPAVPPPAPAPPPVLVAPASALPPPAPPPMPVAIAPPAPPVSSVAHAGNTRITTIGLGASQPIFSTRNAALDSEPRFPWAAFAAVAIACLVAGGVIGYGFGVRRVESVVTGVTTAPPGSRTTTDVPIAAEPPQKPPATPAGAEPRPQGPTAAVQKPDDQPVAPAARAADVRGRIVVRSTPSGAIVTVDGRLHGETPITIRDLSLGAHTLQVARPGFVPRTEQVSLTRAAPSQTLTVELTAGAIAGNPSATTGSVFVDSRPRGARVTIDGRDAGVTPVQIPEVTLGPHTVTFELAGYKGLSAQVVVTPKTPARVSVSLEQIR